MIKIRRLVWDDWNTAHIGKHQVKASEIEEVCQLPLKTLRSYQDRLIILGKTERKRLLTVVLANEKKGKYYVITARDMSKKERGLIK